MVVPQLMGVAVLMTPLLWGEEFGWRGYLQLRLFPGRPVSAAIATGLIWAVWHYPLTLRGYDYPVWFAKTPADREINNLAAGISPAVLV